MLSRKSSWDKRFATYAGSEVKGKKVQIKDSADKGLGEGEDFEDEH